MAQESMSTQDCNNCNFPFDICDYHKEPIIVRDLVKHLLTFNQDLPVTNCNPVSRGDILKRSDLDSIECGILYNENIISTDPEEMADRNGTLVLVLGIE